MNKVIIIGAIILTGGLISATAGSIIAEERMIPGAHIDDYQKADTFIVDSNDVDDLDLDLRNRSINIYTHELSTIEIDYYTAPHDRITSQHVGSTVQLIGEIDPFVNIWGFSFLRHPEIFIVEVYIPSTSTIDINALTSNGGISLVDVTTIGDVNLRSSNGALTLSSIDEVSSLYGETSNGRIELTDVISLTSINMRTSNGRINLTRVNSPLLLTRTSNGKITANNIISADLELSSSNGNVEVSVVGTLEMFRVNMSTTNGNLYLNDVKVVTNAYNTTLEQKIRLTTSNGDIRLNFVS
jgi:hypothetical protein